MAKKKTLTVKSVHYVHTADIDPEATKAGGDAWEGFVNGCVKAAEEALETPPNGYSPYQRNSLTDIFTSMKATHRGIRVLVKLGDGKPESVDALVLARLQLEGLYPPELSARWRHFTSSPTMARRHARDARCLFNSDSDRQRNGRLGSRRWTQRMARRVWTSTACGIWVDGTVRLRGPCRSDLPGRRLPQLRHGQLRRSTVHEDELEHSNDSPGTRLRRELPTVRCRRARAYRFFHRRNRLDSPHPERFAVLSGSLERRRSAADGVRRLLDCKPWDSQFAG
jgi:hypothetical protein